MIFRFTLNNTIEGSQVISNPDGWKEIKLKLERDKEYHSLVEMIELPLIFCGTDGVYDGGYDYIRNIEDTQGIDAQIEILIEVSDNGGAYETFFEGLLELETIKEISDAEPYKLECNIVRNDFWSKFTTRKSQQVNLNASVSLDGDSVTTPDHIRLQLPSQRMFVKTTYENTEDLSITGTENGTDSFQKSAQLGLPYTRAEIKDSFSLGFGEVASVITDVVNIIQVTELGDIDFTINSSLRIQATSTQTIDQVNVTVSVRKNNEGALGFSNSATPLSLSCDETLTVSGSNTITGVEIGDLIYLYVTWGVSLAASGNTTYDFSVGESIIEFTQNSFTENTEVDSFLLRDAAESILSKIISRNNVMYSNYLGDETPTACAANFAIMKGLHVRGYTMNDKPMFMSFDDWWAGANPIFNLGLGYETIGGTEFIRIEDKGYFYDDDYSMTFSNIDGITRVYDKDKIFKSIEIGYEKWSAESASGVDDPQTKHTYNTRFKIIGKDEKVLSKFIAASLAIEQTRRNRVEFGKDWRLDEDTIIIALSNDSSPYQPELDEAFSAITGLLNSDTRYNIRLTPARNFERWKPYFNGCLQLYIPETYNFGSGEGNYDMQSTGDESCDPGTLAENQDIAVTTSFYHGAGVYEFQTYMSWEDYKTVRDNRNKAIRVSNTSSNYKLCKIDVMEFDHFNSLADFTVWIKE